jgi:hypothetical protein
MATLGKPALESFPDDYKRLQAQTLIDAEFDDFDDA